MSKGQRVLLWIVTAVAIPYGLVQLMDHRFVGHRSTPVYDPTGILLLAAGLVAAYLALRRQGD